MTRKSEVLAEGIAVRMLSLHRRALPRLNLELLGLLLLRLHLLTLPRHLLGILLLLRRPLERLLELLSLRSLRLLTLRLLTFRVLRREARILLDG